MNITGSEVASHLPDLGPITQGMEFEPSQLSPNVFQLKNTGNRQNVFFYTKEFYNTFKTEQRKQEALARGENGPVAPVYEKKEMVRIQTPGDKSTYDSFAEEHHKRNYFRHYTNFRDGKPASMGTQLKDAEFIAGSEIIELNYLGIFSIEQLADASDAACERLPRGQELRTAAQTWREVTQDTSLLTSTKKLSAELSASQDMILRLHKEAEEAKKEREEMKRILANMSVNADVQESVTGKVDGRTKAAKAAKEVIAE